jgi:phosphoglycerate dehydrogenase-like enzyme
LPRLLDDRQARRWKRDPKAELAGTVVLVIGFGEMGGCTVEAVIMFGRPVGHWVRRSQSTVGVGGVDAG